MNEPKKTYSEKLKDPRWQRKRLEVLSRDGFACQCCGDKESTLHVHHLEYRRGAEPWEYDQAELQTLCEGCHESETEQRKGCEELLLSALRRRGFGFEEVHGLACAVHFMDRSINLKKAISAIEYAMRLPDAMAALIAKYEAWREESRRSASERINAAVDRKIKEAQEKPR